MLLQIPYRLTHPACCVTHTLKTTAKKLLAKIGLPALVCLDLVCESACLQHHHSARQHSLRPSQI